MELGNIANIIKPKGYGPQRPAGKLR